MLRLFLELQREGPKWPQTSAWMGQDGGEAHPLRQGTLALVLIINHRPKGCFPSSHGREITSVGSGFKVSAGQRGTAWVQGPGWGDPQDSPDFASLSCQSRSATDHTIHTIHTYHTGRAPKKHAPSCPRLKHLREILDASTWCWPWRFQVRPLEAKVKLISSGVSSEAFDVPLRCWQILD